MKKKLKPIPKFDSEKDEREWWQTHDSTKHVDYSTAKHVRFPNLKLSDSPSDKKSVTINLPENIVNRIKKKAQKLNMSYQALIQQYIFEGLAKVK